MNETTKERIRKIGFIEGTKGELYMALETKPHPKIINLHNLKGEQVDVGLFQKGVNLHSQGRARVNELYPWKYVVSGDDNASGTTLYFVDLSSYECSCLWFTNTGRTCKHLVAALIDYWQAHQPSLPE